MAELSEKKYNTPQLIRKYYLSKMGKGNFSSKDAQILLDEFRNILYNPLDNNPNNILTFNDYANQLFLTLDNTTTKNSDFFESVLEETEANNKKIISYLYGMIRTAKRSHKDRIDDRENIILGTAINDACKNLIEEQKINISKIFNKNYYSNNDNLEKIKYDGQSIYLEPQKIIKQNSEKESIDRTRLENYLEYIFTSYPNFKFNIYDLVSLVAKNTDVGSISIFNEASGISNEDEEFNLDNTLTKEISNEHENLIIEKNIVDIWWERVIKKFGSKNNAENYAVSFYLKFYKGYTLEKIETFLKGKIKKSSVDNYTKIFIKVLEIDKNFNSNQSETIKKYIHSFCLLLEQKYEVLRNFGATHE